MKKLSVYIALIFFFVTVLCLTNHPLLYAQYKLNPENAEQQYTRSIGLGDVPPDMKMGPSEFHRMAQLGKLELKKTKNNQPVFSDFSSWLQQSSYPRTRHVDGCTNYKQYNYNDLMSYETTTNGQPCTIKTVGCLLTSFTNLYNKYVREQLSPSQRR